MRSRKFPRAVPAPETPATQLSRPPSLQQSFPPKHKGGAVARREAGGHQWRRRLLRGRLLVAAGEDHGGGHRGPAVVLAHPLHRGTKLLCEPALPLGLLSPANRSSCAQIPPPPPPSIPQTPLPSPPRPAGGRQGRGGGRARRALCRLHCGAALRLHLPRPALQLLLGLSRGRGGTRWTWVLYLCAPALRASLTPRLEKPRPHHHVGLLVPSRCFPPCLTFV